LLIFRNWDNSARWELAMVRNKEARDGMQDSSIARAGDSRKNVNVEDTAFDFDALADAAIKRFTMKDSKGNFVVNWIKLNRVNGEDVSKLLVIKHLILYFQIYVCRHETDDEKCGKEFECKAAYEMHYISKHGGAANYICPRSEACNTNTKAHRDIPAHIYETSDKNDFKKHCNLKCNVKVISVSDNYEPE
jgi:hypothetical protein